MSDLRLVSVEGNQDCSTSNSFNQQEQRRHIMEEPMDLFFFATIKLNCINYLKHWIYKTEKRASGVFEVTQM